MDKEDYDDDVDDNVDVDDNADYEYINRHTTVNFTITQSELMSYQKVK